MTLIPRVAQGHRAPGRDRIHGVGLALGSAAPGAVPGGAAQGRHRARAGSALPAGSTGWTSTALMGPSLSAALGSPVGAGNDFGNVRALSRLRSWELSTLMASSLNGALCCLALGMSGLTPGSQLCLRSWKLSPVVACCPWITSWAWFWEWVWE